MLEDVGESGLEGARAQGLDSLLGDCLGLDVGRLVDEVCMGYVRCWVRYSQVL